MIRHAWHGLIAGTFGLLVCAAALAQTSQPLSDELRAERDREAARAAAQTAEPGLVIETGAQPVVGTEEFCIPVQSIQVEGVTILSDEAVNTAIEDYARTCMGPQAIDALLQVLSDLYVARGYITSRAYIPEQDLSGGVLTLVVVEGRIEDIIFVNSLNGTPLDVPLARRVRTAVPLDPGDLLELRALEQGMDQMNAPGGSNVAVDIQPGQALGGSILVITAEDNDLWRGVVQYRANQTRDDQDETLGLSVIGDNLLQLNDSWSINLNGGINSNALSFGLSLPVRNWTWTGGISYSEQLSQLTATTDLFEQTYSYRLSGQRLLSRDEFQKTFAGMTLAKTDTDRSINGVDLADQSFTTLTFNIDRDITADTAFTGLGLRANFGDRSAGNSFAALTGSARHFRTFSPSWTGYSTLDAQLASSALPSGERFFVGGGGLVRGFEGLSISGDAGFAVTTEFGYVIEWTEDCCLHDSGPARWLSEAARDASPYVFVDAGYVSNKGATSGTMVSAGFGVRTRILEANLDVSVGFPIASQGIAGENGPGLRFAISRKLF